MGENMEKEQWMKESLQMQKASWIQDEITKRREREDELLQQIFMEQKMLQELGCSQLLSISQFDDFGNILYHVNHFHLLVKLESVLRVITETNRFTNIHRTAIRLYLSHQYFDESRFAGSVVSHNPHLLITGKDIGEIIQNL